MPLLHVPDRRRRIRPGRATDKRVRDGFNRKAFHFSPTQPPLPRIHCKVSLSPLFIINRFAPSHNGVWHKSTPPSFRAFRRTLTSPALLFAHRNSLSRLGNDDVRRLVDNLYRGAGLLCLLLTSHSAVSPSSPSLHAQHRHRDALPRPISAWTSTSIAPLHDPSSPSRPSTAFRPSSAPHTFFASVRLR